MTSDDPVEVTAINNISRTIISPGLPAALTNNLLSKSDPEQAIKTIENRTITV